MSTSITKPPVTERTGKRILSALTYNNLLDTSWATARDDTIVNLIQEADLGSIDLEKDLGWATGDKRTVTLSDDSVINLVLTNPRGYPLDKDNPAGPVCNFAIVLDEYLPLSHYASTINTSTRYSEAYDYTLYDDSTNGIEGQALKTLNGNSFFNKLPNYIQGILKTFGIFFVTDKDMRGDIGGGMRFTRKVNIPAIVELLGENTPVNSQFVNRNMELERITPIEYYQTGSNLFHFMHPSDSSPTIWLSTRSYNRYSNNYVGNSTLYYNTANNTIAQNYGSSLAALCSAACPIMCF